MFRAEPTPSNKIQRGMPRPGVVTYVVMLAARVPGVDNEHKQKYIPLPCAHFAVLLACTDRFSPFPAQPATCRGSPGHASDHLVSRARSHGRHHHQVSAHGFHRAVCGRRLVRPIPLCSASACACCVRELILLPFAGWALPCSKAFTRLSRSMISPISSCISKLLAWLSTARPTRHMIMPPRREPPTCRTRRTWLPKWASTSRPTCYRLCRRRASLASRATCARS